MKILTTALFALIAFPVFAHDYCTIVNYADTDSFTVVKVQENTNQRDFIKEIISESRSLEEAVSDAKNCAHINSNRASMSDCSIKLNNDNTYVVATEDTRRSPNVDLENASKILKKLKSTGFCH